MSIETPLPGSIVPSVHADGDSWDMFEALPDGLALARLDGTIVHVNGALATMHGCSREEFTSAVPGHPAIADHYRELLRQAASELGAGLTPEFRRRAPGGDGAGIDVHVRCSLTHFQGEPHILAVVRDMTERSHAERELELRVAARTHELQTLLDLARSTSSSLELDEVLERIIERLKTVIDFSAIAINVSDGEGTIIARRGPGNLAPGSKVRGRFPRLFRELHDAGRPIVIDDVRGDTPLAAAYRQIAGPLLDTQLAHVTSYMSVPLRRAESTWFGSLTVSWHEAGFYSQDDGRLLMAFADHVALAVQNARLFSETQQRTREFETLLDVARLTSELSDLPSALDRIMDQLAIVLPHRGVSILVFEGEDGRYIARRAPGAPAGEVPAGLGWLEVGTVLPGTLRSPLGRLVATRDVVLIDDILGESAEALAYRQTMGEEYLAKVPHVRSFMTVPLRDRTGLRGALSVSWDRPGHFNHTHARILAAFAGHAAIAIENARLYQESTRKAREMEALHRADLALNRSLRLSDVAKAMVDLAVDLLGADGSVLHTWDVSIGRGDIIATSGLPPEIEALVIERFRARTRPIPATLRLEVIEDISTATGLDPEVVAGTGMKSLVELPIVPNGVPFGVFSIGWRRQMTFTDAERRLFETLATRATVAIENARLFERVEATASLEERQRLARELHDSVSQALYGIALGTRTARTWLDRDPAQAKEPLDYALSLAEVGMAEMRALIFELRPESLESEGLLAALARHSAATSARYAIEINTNFPQEPVLSPPVRECLYRIAQEAMHNVVKHAGASRIELLIECDAAGTTLAIRDNGSGFDASQEFHGHLGLKSMRERAARLGGTTDVQSSPGAGTTVTVRFGP